MRYDLQFYYTHTEEGGGFIVQFSLIRSSLFFPFLCIWNCAHHFVHTVFVVVKKSLIKIFADCFMSAETIFFLSLFHLRSFRAHPSFCNNKNIVCMFDLIFLCHFPSIFLSPFSIDLAWIIKKKTERKKTALWTRKTEAKTKKKNECSSVGPFFCIICYCNSVNGRHRRRREKSEMERLLQRFENLHSQKLFFMQYIEKRKWKKSI